MSVMICMSSLSISQTHALLGSISLWMWSCTLSTFNCRC
uniref:Uncharacterized protein n=1 Tax=Anguilla anguilla TaxID=7936 RepID=A0A0E9QSQ7_ANGAN